LITVLKLVFGLRPEQLNTVHGFTPRFSTIYSNIILPSRRSLKLCIPSRVCIQNCVFISHSLKNITYPTYIILDMITLTILGEACK